MNDKEINERIGKAFVSATPDIRGRILSDAGERKENMTNIIIPKKKEDTDTRICRNCRLPDSRGWDICRGILEKAEPGRCFNGFA